METYHGHIKTQLDAILLFEACRLGILPRVQRRLSERERLQIKSGSIYVWNEQETGMKRWTDGKPWSASRVSGSFLTYREMEGVRRSVSPSSSSGSSSKTSPSLSHRKDQKKRSGSASSSNTEGLQYKPGGLYKQSFSLVTADGKKFHLISYYKREDVNSRLLTQPTQDSSLKTLSIPIDFYPDNTTGSNIGPAVIRGPMDGAGSPSSQPQTLAQGQSPSPSAQSRAQPSPPYYDHHSKEHSSAGAVVPNASHQQYLLPIPPPPPPHQPQPHHRHQTSASSPSNPLAATRLAPGAPIAIPAQSQPSASFPGPPTPYTPSTMPDANQPHSKLNLPAFAFPSPPPSSAATSEYGVSPHDSSAVQIREAREYSSTEDRRALQQLDRGFMV